MKFNFKRIASVLTSAVMLSSTVALAAAAGSTFPAPYTAGGINSVAVVYGTNAQLDLPAAMKIAASFGTSQTTTTTTTTSVQTISGEKAAVESGSVGLYLGDSMYGVKESFTKTDLPTILADGEISDADGSTFTYKQKIYSPVTSVKYGETRDNIEPPVLYADLDASTINYSMELRFPTAVNVTKFADKNIKLFGREYSFSGSASQLTSSTVTLFEKSQAVRVNDGESKVVNGHTITVAIEDASTASITVDGVSESKTEGWSGKINGVDLYLKNVVGPNVAGTSRFAELYLNSNKVVLTDGAAVQIGSEDITGTSVEFGTSGTKVSTITIFVTPRSLDDEKGQKEYIKMGDSFTDPVFGTVKWSLISADPDLNSSAREEIVLKTTGENKAGMEFTNYAGGKYNLDMFTPSSVKVLSNYVENTTNGVYNATKLGYDTYDFATSSTDTVVKDDYFITCDREYSQVWRISSISLTSTTKGPYITVKDQASGSSSVEASFTASAENSTATLAMAGGRNAVITLYDNSSGTETVTIANTCPLIYTKNGALINLTQADADGNTTLTNGNIGLITITEETPYNGGEYKNITSVTLGSFSSGEPSTLQARLLWQARSSGKDMQIISATPNGTADGHYWDETVGDYDTYSMTKYGSYQKFTGETDKTLKIYYPGEAMKLGFYISEQAAAVTTSGNDTTTTNGVVPVLDSEVSKFSDKNIIVVGGSCINTVAARLLGSNTPLCAADFTKATGVGAGEYLVKTFASPYNASKIATLVAGYEAQQTQNAADFLLSQNVSVAVGDTYVTGTKKTVGAGTQ